MVIANKHLFYMMLRSIMVIDSNTTHIIQLWAIGRMKKTYATTASLTPKNSLDNHNWVSYCAGSAVMV